MLSGGLGDLIWQFFTDPALRRLPAIRKKYPDFKLQLVVSSFNNHAWEIYRGQTDCILAVPYPARFETCKALGLPYVGYLPGFFDFEETPTQCFLTPEEQTFVKAFPRGFVAIHPFAGELDRAFVKKIDVPSIAKFIHRLTGRHVIVFGGSHVRTWSGGSITHEEEFHCDESYVTSLVDQVNIRVALHLLGRASYFVGTHSALMLGAWALNLPTLILGSYRLFAQYIFGGHPLDPYHRKLFAPGNYFVREEEFPALRRFLACFLGPRRHPGLPLQFLHIDKKP